MEKLAPEVELNSEFCRLELQIMESTILFEETQSFARKVVLQFFTAIIGLLLLGGAIALITHGSGDVSAGLLIAALSTALVVLLLRKMRLITQVRSDGICLRYPPLQNRFSFFSWDSIQRIYIRQYHPIGEYGGWGLRFGPNGRAYNVSGNIGIQLIFTDGTKLLIGTREPEKIATLLRSMNKLDAYLE